MNRSISAMTALLVAMLGLAGCVSEGGDVDEEPTTIETADCVEAFCGQEAIIDQATGRDLRTDLTAADTLAAPVWRVGDVFEQHIYYGSADTSGEHIQTMVVDDSGSCYTVATTSQNAANFEASFNLPVLGCIGKTNLETALMFNEWPWMYDFPLQEGKSWAGELQFMINWNDYSLHDYSFTLTATFDEAINTWTGDFPGFVIVGMTDEGEELLRYNYVPAVGWFTHLWIWDLSTDAPDDVIFHAMSMGTSTGYTGPYYLNEGEEIMREQVGAVLGNQEKVVRQFQTGDATVLKGVIAPIACGTSKIVINTPSNQQHQYDHVYEETPDQCAGIVNGDSNYVPPTWYSVYWVEEPAEAGDYTMTYACSGLCGYFAWLTAVTEKQYELTAEMLPPEDS